MSTLPAPHADTPCSIEQREPILSGHLQQHDVDAQQLAQEQQQEQQQEQAQLAQQLQHNGVVPIHVQWLSHTNSTRHAIAKLPSDAPRVVVADQQSQGNGQSGRVWQSPQGNLYLSYAQALNAPLQGHLALEVALALLKMPWLQQQQGLCIKWPNDLQQQQNGIFAKWGGILIEPLHNDSHQHQQQHHQADSQIMVGVGLNLQPMQQHVTEQAVGYLASPDGQAWNRPQLAAQVVHAIRQAIDLFCQGSPQLAQRFAAVDALHGHALCLQRPNLPDLHGIGAGIGADGALKLRTNNGIQAFYHGRVRRMDEPNT